MKWKHFLRQIFTPLQLYEPVEHNQNPFKYTIQNFKAGLGKIRNDCGKGVLAYHWESMEYIFGINDYISQASLWKMAVG